MRTESIRTLIVAALVGVLSLLAAAAPSQAAEKRPNILLIVADDMGYSDIGAFGGEIKTPNLDALAARGLRATSFHVGPTCSPTRSMLLSGTDNHVAGLGNMAEFLGPKQKGKPGYEGHLNDRVVTLATVLRGAGYHTYMAGKWHLGEEPGSWPAARGFERDFTLLQGGGSNWADMAYPNPAHPRLTFTLNGKPLEKLPENHFSSEAYANFIMKSVDENKDDGKPFFAYLSFQAVHSPFAVPNDWLDRYRGRYDKGYEALRASRIARMKEMGVVRPDVVPFPGFPVIPAWGSLTPAQQKLSARRMEIYAAMLANMDYHIGRVLDHLEEAGSLDDTLVIFFSDNGAEPVELASLIEAAFSPEARKWFQANFDLRPENWGKRGSAVDYGPAWAQVGSVPFRGFKGYVAEGGIRSPLIVAGPGVRHAGDINTSLLHVMDIAPTLYELAGAQHPSKRPGSTITPLQGKSLVPLLTGSADSVRGDRDWVGWELFGNRAVRKGDWKILNTLRAAGGSGDWQLYDLENDPGETRDLAKQNPRKLDELIALWDRYATQNGVILTGDGPYRKGKERLVEDDLYE
ncbi:MAG: arylsulfatase [Myxococcota bacterium]